MRPILAAAVALSLLAPAAMAQEPPGLAAAFAGATPTRAISTAPDDFYAVPNPLPHGRPGAVIRKEPAPQRAGATTAVWRVMYHSRDAQDRDVAVTGIVTVPAGPAPAGGWPVISWGHGTTGMAAACAPSRDGAKPQMFGVAGVGAASDYLGLGPIGQLHAFLSGPSEGRGMIDAVRAAREIAGSAASARWLSIGASQGGHASLFAGEEARAYAPDLKLLGVVAWAPSSEMEATFAGNSPSLSAGIGIMSLYGLAVDHPKLKPGDYVTPQVAAWAGRLNAICLADIARTMGQLPPDKIWTHDPKLTEPARSLIRADSPGRRLTSAPILIVQGEGDIVVSPARSRALLARECATNRSAEAIFVPGGKHEDAGFKAGPQINAWLNDRLAGKPAGSSCPAP